MVFKVGVIDGLVGVELGISCWTESRRMEGVAVELPPSASRWY